MLEAAALSSAARTRTLLEIGGAYARMWALQQEEADLHRKEEALTHSGT